MEDKSNVEENLINENESSTIDSNNNKDKKKSLKKNYFYNLAYQIFLLIVPLITTPYVSRVLTPEGVGQYSFSFSLITFFTLFGALGFGYYAQRAIASKQNSSYEQSKVFWEIIICRFIPVFIALLVNFILCFLKVYKEYTNLMLIFSINIFALAFDIAFYYQGKEEFSKLVIRNFIIKLLSVMAIFLFVKSQNDLYKYATINALSVLISSISMWFLLFKYICKVRIKEIKPLRHLKGTIILFLPTIAVSIYTILDKTLIGLMIRDTYSIFDADGKEVIKKYSDLENGYYEQSEKMVKMIMTIITSIGTVMIPRNSREFSEGNYEQVRRNIFTSCSLVLLIGIPLVLGLIVISDNFVPWFFGDGYEKCIVLMKILSPLIIIIGFSNVFGLQYLLPTKKDKSFTFSLICGAVINLSLNAIFITFWWSIGAAVATVISECIVTIIMAIIIRKEINFFKVLINGWKYYLSGTVMFIVCYFVSFKMESSIINTCIIVLAGCFVYLSMLIILREKYILLAINKVKSRIIKKKR